MNRSSRVSKCALSFCLLAAMTFGIYATTPQAFACGPSSGDPNCSQSNPPLPVCGPNSGGPNCKKGTPSRTPMDLVTLVRSVIWGLSVYGLP
jgi:hypothetical protein